jgi:plastocyanin
MGISSAHTDVLTFAPTPRTVKAGDQVTFVNNTSAPHTSRRRDLVPDLIRSRHPGHERPI